MSLASGYWDRGSPKQKTPRESTCCETLNKNLPRTNTICSERIAPARDRAVGGFCYHDRIRRDLVANDVCSAGARRCKQHQ